MCHLGGDHIEQLIREKLSADLKLTSSAPMSDLCKSCVSGKQHRHPFPKSAEHAPGVLDRIFSDVHGPMPVQSCNGQLYWATFIDDASLWMEAYELAKKSDLFAAFLQFKVLVEKQTGQNIKCFHNDEGGEFKLKALIKFCKEEGIRIEWTTRATPQQNGVAECSNRTIGEAITAMLDELNLPPSFWNEALNVYCHVHNCCPIVFKSPVWSGFLVPGRLTKTETG